MKPSKLILFHFALSSAAVLPAAAYPAWWSAPGSRILEAGAPAHDFSPANLGQLKNVATQAKNYLDFVLASGGGAGPEINAICQFTNSGNYSPVNIGQLKNVAKPFYDRLAQIHYNWRTGTTGVASPLYPWTVTTGPENAAPANLGQLKNVFSFEPNGVFLLDDEDADGLPSWWEYQYGLNPAASNSATGDEDSDGLNNLWEFKLGLNPRLADSNSNGISDALEDRDQDGLTNISELSTHHTLPDQPDTDGDGLSDGWEILYGYLALVNNETDADQTNDPDDDPDNDGLLNSAEDQIGTNPNNGDTDGDGFSDRVENEAASGATNAASTPGNPGGTPGGPTAPPPPTIPVQVNFGDQSGSHSEKYRVWLEPLEGDANTQKRYRTNRKYGQTQTETFYLPTGAKYKITFTHISTDPNYHDNPKPDYDYTLEIPQLAAAANTIRIVKDTQGLMGVHYESDSFFAAGKSADLFVMRFKTETISSFPPNTRDRKKLGVGEESEVTVTPTSAGTLNWSLLNQKDATVAPATGYSVSFTADTRKKDTSLRATFDTGDTYDILWNVVQPTGERARKTGDLTFPAGQQGVGMTVEYTTLPDDVSFYRVEMLEVDKGTSNVTGFFTPFSAANLQHHPNPLWVLLLPDNRWNDTASFERWGFPPSSGHPPSWSYGTYQWAIDVMWRTVGEVGNGLLLGTRTQLHTLHDGTGRSTESKSGESATRTP